MKEFIYLLVLLSVSCSPLKHYDIDLDDDAKYRALLRENQDSIRAYTALIKDKFSRFVPVLKQLTELYPINTLEEEFGEMGKYIKVTKEELNLPYEDILSGFIIYEMSGCTSAVVRGTANRLFLARNLDFFFEDNLKGMFMSMDFYRKGELQYKGVHFLGFGSMMNVTRPGEYSISLNQRFSKNREEIIKNLLLGYLPTAFTLSYVVVKAETFDEALKLLGETEVAGNVYLILAAPKEHALILERSPERVDKIINIGQNKGIVATNRDSSENCFRRNAALKQINSLSEGQVGFDSLMELLTTRPVHCNQTIYSIVIDVSTGESVSLAK